MPVAPTMLPYNGIEPTMIEPPTSITCTDPDVTLNVFLNVIRARSTDNHWMLTCTVSNGIIRRLQIVRETGYNHLTNWGPLTVTAGNTTKFSPQIWVGELTPSRRKVLEGIAWNTPVMMRNGEWNCQNWTTNVLMEAVRQNLLKNEIVDRALITACGVPAYPY